MMCVPSLTNLSQAKGVTRALAGVRQLLASELFHAFDGLVSQEVDDIERQRVLNLVVRHFRQENELQEVRQQPRQIGFIQE